MTYYDPLAPAPAQPQTPAAPADAPADAPTPAPLAIPAQAFMSTSRVGIDANGDIWQFQGTAGVVKVGTGAIPQSASQPD